LPDSHLRGDTDDRRHRVVWESEAAAREFFSPELTERVTGLYGVRPEIRFVEVAALVDNGAGVPA
jgi:hypothetical protein